MKTKLLFLFLFSFGFAFAQKDLRQDAAFFQQQSQMYQKWLEILKPSYPSNGRKPLEGFLFQRSMRLLISPFKAFVVWILLN